MIDEYDCEVRYCGNKFKSKDENILTDGNGGVHYVCPECLNGLFGGRE